MNIPDLVRLSTERNFSCQLDFLLNTGSGTFGSKKCLCEQKTKISFSVWAWSVFLCV